MRYFTDIAKNVPSIKKEYKRLAHILHPDKGGNTKDMQTLNSEYLEMLRQADGSIYKDNDKQYTYSYNESIEISIIEKINELLTKGIDKIADIYLIGAWLWLLNTNKKDKETLKDCKLRWSNQRKAWYFHSGKYKYFNNKSNLNSIAQKYGADKVFRKNNQQAITN